MNREEIADSVISLMRVMKGPLKINEIAKSLGIYSDAEEYDSLKDILSELVDNDIVLKHSRNKYELVSGKFNNLIEYTGILRIRNDKGYVESNNPSMPLIVVVHRDLNTALDGDKVLVRLLAQKSGRKPRASVVKIIERNRTHIIGTIDFDGSFYFLIPDEEKYYIDFLIPESKLAGAKNGDKVSASLIQWNDPTKSPKVEVVKIIGRAGIPVVEYESVMQDFELPFEYPVNPVKEAESFSKTVEPKKFKDRLDLRNELIITIDPEDARDFDDALSLNIMPDGNFRLGVHIADVSHYVAENTELDAEARFRATSVYLVDRVVNMLPEALSNGICSLNPRTNRLAFSVFMEINNEGIVKNYEIAESIIKSKRRYNYDEALEIIESANDNEEAAEQPDELTDLILKLHKLAQILKKRRYKQGGVEFDTYEIKFRLDENKFPAETKMKVSNAATSLVEECMLIANKTVAEHITKLSKKYKLPTSLPFLYRTHEEPNGKIIEEALNFISTIVKRVKPKKTTSKDINTVLQYVKNTPEKYIVNQVLIRSMAKAIYTTNNVGHFGLGFKDYCHFTSPIRRYPDLMAHRVLKEYNKALPDKQRLKFLNILLRQIGNHSTEKERNAMEAERASIKLTHAVLAQKRVGDEFNATVSGVTSFGLFVVLDGLFSEGLLHIRDLLDDYYTFEEQNYRLVGKRTKRVFSIGKRLRVRIINVNLKKRTIDLAFLGECEI